MGPRSITPSIVALARVPHMFLMWMGIPLEPLSETHVHIDHQHRLQILPVGSCYILVYNAL